MSLVDCALPWACGQHCPTTAAPHGVAAALDASSNSTAEPLPLAEYSGQHTCDEERHASTIERSLSHWPRRLGAAEITAAITAAAPWDATVLVAIRANRLYADTSRLVAGRQYWVQMSEQLLELLEAVRVDDCHFVLSLNDGAVVELTKGATSMQPPALLSMFGSAEHADILVPGNHLLEWARPSPVFVEEVGEDLAAWEQRGWAVEGIGSRGGWASKEPTLFWRGTNSFARRRASGARECTGASFLSNCTARATLVAASLRTPDEIDAGFASFTPWDNCLCGSEYAGVKAATAKPYAPMEAQQAYRYLASVDGYTAANRLARLLSLGSLVLKQCSHYAEFFYGWLVPHEHLLPIAEDLSDLRAQLAWARAHDDEAARIAAAGQRLVREALSLEQLRCYWARLLNAYAARQRGSDAAADGGGGGGGGGGSGADGGGGGADQRMPQAFEGIFARRVLGDEWFDPSELTHLLVP